MDQKDKQTGFRVCFIMSSHCRRLWKKQYSDDSFGKYYRKSNNKNSSIQHCTIFCQIPKIILLLQSLYLKYIMECTSTKSTQRIKTVCATLKILMDIYLYILYKYYMLAFAQNVLLLSKRHFIPKQNKSYKSDICSAWNNTSQRICTPILSFPKLKQHSTFIATW